MKKWIAVLLCVVLLTVDVPSTRAITAEDVYFTAVNISLLPLSMDTMPIWVGGQIYVPASVFDSSRTGADLGVSLTRLGSKNTVILLAERKTMIFDTSAGTCKDQYDNPIPNCKAVTRKGTAFVPLAQVCSYFGLVDSYTYTRYGYLVRVKTPSAPLTDEQFVEMAGNLMQTRMKDFIQANTPAVPEDTKPPASQEPVNPNPPVETPPAENPPEEEDPPEEEPPENKVQLYLAFRCEGGAGLEKILNSMNRNRVKGVFLFAPEQLVNQDDLVRRVVGQGHIVGLLASDDAQAQLSRGNELLQHIACTAATVAMVPSGQRAELEGNGWVCWRQTADGTPRSGERATTYINRLTRLIGTQERAVYLTLDDSTTTANVLDGALKELIKREYTIVTPLESRL